MRISTFAFLLSVIALSACQVMPGGETSSTTVSDPSASVSGDQAPNPISSTSEEAALAPAKTLAPIDDRPERFLGLSTTELSQELGEPQLRRREAPAEIWQYRGEVCVLDLFLYPQSGTLQVTHIEARDKKAESYETKDCLKELIEARRTTPIG